MVSALEWSNYADSVFVVNYFGGVRFKGWLRFWVDFAIGD